MILKYKQLDGDVFANAFKELLTKEVSTAQAIEIADSVDPINKEIANIRSKKIEFIKKYGIDLGKTEAGDDQYTLNGISEETNKEFTEAYLEMLETTFEIPLSKKVLLKKEDTFKPAYAYVLKDIIEIKK